MVSKAKHYEKIRVFFIMVKPKDFKVIKKDEQGLVYIWKLR